MKYAGRPNLNRLFAEERLPQSVIDLVACCTNDGDFNCERCCLGDINDNCDMAALEDLAALVK